MAQFHTIRLAAIDGNHVVAGGVGYGVAAVDRHHAALQVLIRRVGDIACHLQARHGQQLVADADFFLDRSHIERGRYGVGVLAALYIQRGFLAFACHQLYLAQVLRFVAQDGAGFRILHRRRVAEHTVELALLAHFQRVVGRAPIHPVAGGEQSAFLGGAHQARRLFTFTFAQYLGLHQEGFDQALVHGGQRAARQAFAAHAWRDADDFVLAAARGDQARKAILALQV
ncbi:hypothetical protein D3C72_1156380 [compost metagenome]